MKSFKLSFDESRTQLYLDQDKGVIVCHLYGEIWGIRWEGSLDEIEGVGVARLKQGDKFNPNVGYQIAQAKAESNAYRKARNIVLKRIKESKALIDGLNRFNEKVDYVVSHNENFIHRIGGYVKEV